MKKRKTLDGHPWHALTPGHIYQELAATEQGLSRHEAQRRLAQFGYNTLSPENGRGSFKRFISQFHNVLVYLLLAAAGVTAAIGHLVDSGVIVGVVLVNALIGFIQEGKAEKALAAIRSMLTQETMVLRDGKNMHIPAEELVPGDVVPLESGDKVPADMRLLQVKNLRIDESMLTGESLPVEKNTAATAANAALAERYCVAYSGTLVTYGTGLGLVVATGDNTEIGRISSMLLAVPELVTPLLRQIAGFSRWLSAAIIGIASISFGYGWYIQHSSLKDLFMSSVGLAVAAIPEGLPAIMTITLAIGVQRMARRHAIIRRLPAVETLGSVTVICSDKTGTLTCNEMTVKSLIADNRLITVDGVGYDPHGGFVLNNQAISIDNHPQMCEIIRAAALCNNARLEEKSGNWLVHGDPTEGAIVTLALKSGIDPDFLNQEMPRTDSIPFESEHRFMATLHHDHHGHAFIFVKGAPERLFAMCSSQRVNGQDTPIDIAYWQNAMDSIARFGQRVLAIGFKVAYPSQNQLNFDDVETGLTLLGLIGMIDPPRSEAIQAVQKCQNAGIRVKMITGDHATTAAAIATQLNIGNGSVVTGAELDRMTDSEFKAAICHVDVFARTSPENKLHLVTALQANGQVVAMTGDGVNDSPALKRADVGVAMGKKGTEVAKEASEIVLADDNFASIAHAVEEGRSIYENLKKSIIFILPTGFGEAFVIVAAIITGEILPITPVQILWVNTITAVMLSLTLAFELPERNTMTRNPRKPQEPLLTGFLVWRIVFVTAIMVTGAFGLFLWERSLGTSVEEARTVTVNTLVMFEVFYLFNSRYLHHSVLSLHGLFGNKLIWLAVMVLILFQLAFTHWQPMQMLFGTSDIDAHTWRKIVAVASSVFLLVEIEKIIFWLLQPKKSKTFLDASPFPRHLK